MTKTLPPALSVCNECFGKLKLNERFIICTCPHNRAVAIMPIKDSKPSGIWRIFTPATPEDVAKIFIEIT